MCQKFALSLTVSEIFAIFHFLQKFKMAAKIVKIENFHVPTEYSSTTLWVQTSLEIALSLTVSEIFVIFNFLQKFKMAAKKVVKIENFHVSTEYYYPVGPKFARNSSISDSFRDICHFSFSAKIQGGCQNL